jgi:hypothetical protein
MPTKRCGKPERAGTDKRNDIAWQGSDLVSEPGFFLNKATQTVSKLDVPCGCHHQFAGGTLFIIGLG